jgi:predicted amidophosphoribosyltransferase
MPKTTREYLDEYRKHFWQVPHEDDANVCRLCLGAVAGNYDQCFNCNELLRRSEAPASLRGRVVPMSIARNPGAWYSILQSYKKGAWPEYAPVVASLTYEWLTAHEVDLSELLGGEPDLLTIVPSKKMGMTFERQHLRLALALVASIANRLTATLDCVDPAAYHRTKYTSQMFRARAGTIEGKRILLIEDTWITGATAVSAAGALLAAGAQSVVIAPIARDFRVQFHAEDHPYLARIAREYDVRFWPRSIS